MYRFSCDEKVHQWDLHYGTESLLRSLQYTQSKNSLYFMKPKSLLMCSQGCAPILQYKFENGEKYVEHRLMLLHENILLLHKMYSCFHYMKGFFPHLPFNSIYYISLCTNNNK